VVWEEFERRGQLATGNGIGARSRGEGRDFTAGDVDWMIAEQFKILAP
jgi:hypothetical protein